jgi:hypothetical protein
MKSNFITGLLTALSMVIITSCEKPVTNVDLPNANPKPVVFCYLSPGSDTIIAEVFYSRPINKPSPPMKITIVDSEVKITEEGGQTVTLQYDPGRDNFYAVVESSFLKENSRYRISVKAPNGDQVDANCELPVQNTSLRITQIDSVITQESVRYLFTIEFDDIIGKPDFYRLYSSATMQQVWEQDTSVYEYNLGFNYGNQFIAVKERDGETFVATTQIEIWSYEFWTNEKLIGAKFYLLSTDEPYYLFHTSLQNHSPDDPFAEPTIVYSNVNNGVGVFAGFHTFGIDVLLSGEFSGLPEKVPPPHGLFMTQQGVHSEK